MMNWLFGRQKKAEPEPSCFTIEGAIDCGYFKEAFKLASQIHYMHPEVKMESNGYIQKLWKERLSDLSKANSHYI
jgi:hypothetical protein